MNKLFKINEATETRNEYLKRMAPVIDSLQNGDLKHIIPEEEQQEIKDYVFRHMYDYLLKESAYRVRKYNLKNQEDCYLNQLCLEVWQNFYKFNNPKYKDHAGACSFTTFILPYARSAAREILEMDNGVSRYETRVKRIVEKTQKYLSETYGLKKCEMTPELVFEFASEVTTDKKLSKKMVRTIMNSSGPKLSLDVESAEKGEWCSEVEDAYIATDSIKCVFKEFLDGLTLLQKFFMCQNYGFCCQKYDGYSLRKLGSNRLFIQLCKDDEFGKNHILRSKENDSEYVGKDYINGQKNKCDKLIREFIQKKQMDEYDVLSCFTQMLNETWDKLAADYGFED